MSEKLKKPRKVISIRLFPTEAQEFSLIKMNSIRNIIWNELLHIRNDHYEKTKKSLSSYDLNNYIPELVRNNTALEFLNSKAAQAVSRQIVGSFSSYFQLKKNGDKKARPPNFIEENKITSITFNQSGWTLKKHKIKISKIKEPIYYKSKHDVRNLNVKEVVIKYKDNKWLCDLVIEYDIKEEYNNKDNVLALDLGLKTLATGIDSTGKVIHLKNEAKKIAKYFTKQIAKVSKKIDTKIKGSRRHKKLSKTRDKLYKTKNSQVKQTLHIQSKELVNMNYHTIVIGDLSVKELMSKEKSYKNVRKSFHHSAIDIFRTFLTYKCQGKTRLVEIDESYTTQTNCLTGTLFPSHVDLSKREVEITAKIIIDREINSAINIYNRYQRKELAELIPPLDLSSALKNNNMFVEKKFKMYLEPPML